MMKPLSFKRHRFPPDTICLAVWLYFRLTTSLRDGEEMLAECGIDTTYETVRCWANKFGPAIAAKMPVATPQPDRRRVPELLYSATRRPFEQQVLNVPQ